MILPKMRLGESQVPCSSAFLTILCALFADGQNFWLKSWCLRSPTFLSIEAWSGAQRGADWGSGISLLVFILRAAPELPSDMADSLGKTGLSFPGMSKSEGEDPR